MVKLLAFSVLLISCQGPSGNNSSNRTDKANSIITHAENKEVTCKDLVSDLVKSSNAIVFKHFNHTLVHSRIDQITSEKATIKLFVTDISDRAGKEQTVENVVGWLEFYRQTGELVDITDDPENPVVLAYDKSILQGKDIFKLCNAAAETSCICNNAVKTDSLIFATAVKLKTGPDSNTLSFRCASISKGIASVIDTNGNQSCIDMYDVRCVSSDQHILALSKNFKYFTEDLEAPNLFFKEIKDKLYFEFSLNKKREIISISKVNIN